MTSRDFCYWLQGLFELGNPPALSPEQTTAVKKHLALVFVHEIDPSAGGPDMQKKLNEIHEQAKKANEATAPHFSDHGPGGVTYRC